MRKKTPEGYVLSACKDYLELKGWDVTRMNSGALQDKRGIPVRMHAPGTADLLATKKVGWNGYKLHEIYWVECKAPNGKQSDKQKAFQERKEALGHGYVLAYSIDDLAAAGL